LIDLFRCFGFLAIFGAGERALAFVALAVAAGFYPRTFAKTFAGHATPDEFADGALEGRTGLV
jgi:hypothetical protein